MTVQVAEHKAAAVGVHQGRHRTRHRRRPVYPHGDATSRPSHGRVTNLADLFGSRRRDEAGPDRRAGLWAGHRVHGRESRVERVDDSRDLGIQVHAYCSSRTGRTALRSGRACCRVGATRRGPSSMSRQIPIAVMRTGAARRWSNAIRLMGPHTDTAATASPGAPIGAATQPNPGTDSSRSKATPRAANIGQFGAQLCRRTDRIPGLSRAQIDDVGLITVFSVGQHRLADRRAMRGLAAAHPGGYRRHHLVADLLQVDHVGAVEDRQMHHQPRRAVQIMQQGHRGAV